MYFPVNFVKFLRTLFTEQLWMTASFLFMLWEKTVLLNIDTTYEREKVFSFSLN